MVPLWEENVGILVEGCSYKLKNFRIIGYENVKYIAMCWEGRPLIYLIFVMHFLYQLTLRLTTVILYPSVNPKTFFKCLHCG